MWLVSSALGFKPGLPALADLIGCAELSCFMSEQPVAPNTMAVKVTATMISFFIEPTIRILPKHWMYISRVLISGGYRDRMSLLAT